MYTNLHKPNQRQKWRNRFVNFFQDHVIFTLSKASMHGLIHVVRSKRLLFERFLWIVLVVAAFSAAVQQALQAWKRYETSPVVITVQKDFFNWVIDFPSVVICLREKSSTAHKFLQTFKLRNNITADVEDLENYVDDLLFKNYFNYLDLERYANGSRKDLISTDLFVELVNSTSARIPSHSENIKWPKDVDDEYSLILTEFGVCHGFHSKLSNYFAIGSFINENRPNSTFKKIGKNYKEAEVSLYINTISEGYLLFVINSNEIIDITSHFFVLYSDVTLSLNVLDIVSDNIEDLSPAQRNCKYNNENDDSKRSPVYTYNLCRRDCRINLCLKFCKCIPYYYKKTDNEQICNMTGMYCLSKYPELRTLTNPETGDDLCPCLQNCDTQEITADVISRFSNSSLTVKFDSFPRERYKRSLIFSKTDLLIQVGSLFGLFLGCSVLSLIEIPYFLTLRFFWGVFGNKPIKPNV